MATSSALPTGSFDRARARPDTSSCGPVLDLLFCDRAVQRAPQDLQNRHHQYAPRPSQACMYACRSGNILLTDGLPHKRRAKLGDLGLARTLQMPVSTAVGVQGTFIYMVSTSMLHFPASAMWGWPVPAVRTQAARAGWPLLELSASLLLLPRV